MAKLASTSDCQEGADLNAGHGVVDRQQLQVPDLRTLRPYSRRNGVTALLISITSPLGKLLLPCPWNQRFGLSVSAGRVREKASFIVLEVNTPRTTESTDCQ